MFSTCPWGNKNRVPSEQCFFSPPLGKYTAFFKGGVFPQGKKKKKKNIESLIL